MSLKRPFCAAAATVCAFSTLPSVNAEPVVDQGSAEDLGVMSISLKEIVKPQVGIQARSQGAGTPSMAGIGAFLPLFKTKNSVLFADIQGNVNFPDVGEISSVVNTTISGSAISSSSRLGLRWLNGDRNWMYGLNAGYDTRPVTSSGINSGTNIGGEKTFLFQQAGINVEAISEKLALDAYALLPASETQHKLDDSYQVDELTTLGINIGRHLNHNLKASIGYYLQLNPAEEESDGSGVLGRLSYAIDSSTLIGASVTYDKEFKTKASFDITWRFKTHSQESGAPLTDSVVVSALSAAPPNRDIRIEIE